MFKNIRIVLCYPSHPGNIGAVARAMKTMGLSQLILVSPKDFPSIEATKRASGAEDVLAQTQVVETLEEAIQDCEWVFGTSARTREFPWPLLNAKEAATKIVGHTRQGQRSALVFGRERSGLTNEELQRCDAHIHIPSHPEYSSLNLASAVQIMTYELYQTIESPQTLPEFEKATAKDIQGLNAHFEETATKLHFLDPDNPQKLMTRIQRLWAKAQLEKEEVNILRGFFKAAQRQT